jgi:hypothetical protein
VRLTKRLTKRDVERLLADYDADPVGALTVALRRATGAVDTASWADVVALATADPHRREALLRGDVAALDELARELNELRGLAPDPGPPAATRSPARGRATR